MSVGEGERDNQMNEKVLVGWEGAEGAELLCLNIARGSLRKALQELKLSNGKAKESDYPRKPVVKA